MKSNQQGALDFEWVDVAEARRVLDEEGPLRQSALPLPPRQPQAFQPLLQALDAALKPKAPVHTARWVFSLPPRCRPLYLLTHYPKIATRFAELWVDPKLAQRYLDELLLDRRGDRNGFPSEVFADLMRMHEHLQRRGA